MGKVIGRVLAVEEQEILTRAKSGSDDAFQQIVEQYRRRIYSLAIDLTGRAEDAEDISQEVFLKAYLAMQNFRGDAKLGSWLYRITVNTCMDHRRKSAFKFWQRKHEKTAEELTLIDPKCSPEQTMQSRLLQKEIEKALEKLTARERTVFVLRHYNELMLKEIAEILQISEGTVKSLLFRAVKRLQETLGPLRAGLAGVKK